VTLQLLNRSRKSFKAILQEARTELKEVRARVRSLSPQSTLDRGYAVIQKGNGDLVRSPNDVKQGELVQLRLAKGEIGAQITKQDQSKSVSENQTNKKGK
jgi:exodeoxyribonuclease VII large subunit